MKQTHTHTHTHLRMSQIIMEKYLRIMLVVGIDKCKVVSEGIGVRFFLDYKGDEVSKVLYHH